MLVSGDDGQYKTDDRQPGKCFMIFHRFRFPFSFRTPILLPAGGGFGSNQADFLLVITNFLLYLLLVIANFAVLFVIFLSREAGMISASRQRYR